MSVLVELFRHNRWANLRLLDACAGLRDEQLDGSVSGTYGRARDTLAHLVAAEGRYVVLLTGVKPERPYRESEGWPGIAALREHVARTGGALIAIAETAKDSDTIETVYQGEKSVVPVPVLLTQAINHATEHRAQVNTILTQQGVEPPALDGWHYGEELERSAAS